MDFFKGFFKKVFVEFVTVLLLFYVSGFWLEGMWGLSSLDRGSNQYFLRWKAKS